PISPAAEPRRTPNRRCRRSQSTRGPPFRSSFTGLRAIPVNIARQSLEISRLRVFLIVYAGTHYNRDEVESGRVFRNGQSGGTGADGDGAEVQGNQPGRRVADAHRGGLSPGGVRGPDDAVVHRTTAREERRVGQGKAAGRPVSLRASSMVSRKTGRDRAFRRRSGLAPGPVPSTDGDHRSVAYFTPPPIALAICSWVLWGCWRGLGMVKVVGRWRGGNSSNVFRYSPTRACAGTRRNMRSAAHFA